MQSGKMSLLQGFQIASWETQVLSCAQTQGFLWGKCKTYLAFLADWLPTVLFIFLD